MLWKPSLPLREGLGGLAFQAQCCKFAPRSCGIVYVLEYDCKMSQLGERGFCLNATR